MYLKVPIFNIKFTEYGLDDSSWMETNEHDCVLLLYSPPKKVYGDIHKLENILPYTNARPKYIHRYIDPSCYDFPLKAA